MRIGITGSDGLIGSRLLGDLLAFDGLIPLAIESDIRDTKKLAKEIRSKNVNMLVHCAALTDVEYCEEHPEEALAVNAEGVHNILNVFDGNYFIYLSTDHVFHGKRFGVAYTEKHEPSPVNMYGLTKLAGEGMAKFFFRKTVIVRASKVFTAESLYGSWDVLNSGLPLTFTDVIKRSFVHIDDFINGLIYIILNVDGMPEIIHLAGLDTMSYYKFWRMIAVEKGIDPELVVPRKTKLKDLPPRPYNGGLNCGVAKKLGVPLYHVNHGIKLLDWKE